MSAQEAKNQNNISDIFIFEIKKTPYSKGVCVSQACFLCNIYHLNLRQNHQF
jgi:hypothetical protein